MTSPASYAAAPSSSGSESGISVDPSISVILCTRNGADVIVGQLEALGRQVGTTPFELVVVDNGSNDGTAEVVHQWWSEYSSQNLRFLNLRVIDASERAGLAFARNVGAAAAKANKLAFCDDDDVVGQGWVDSLSNALDSNPLVASALSYDLLNPPELLTGRARFQSTGIEELFGLPVCAGACGVTNELWQHLGGNDENLLRTGEDFDFSLRAFSELGVRPVFAAGAEYHHRLRSDARGTFEQARAFGSSHATLWARFGSDRCPEGEVRAAASDWWWIISRSPFAAFGRRRELWLRHAGRRIGRLEGSLRHRVFLP